MYTLDYFVKQYPPEVLVVKNGVKAFILAMKNRMKKQRELFSKNKTTDELTECFN